jgi:hypothetical protein
VGWPDKNDDEDMRGMRYIRQHVRRGRDGTTQRDCERVRRTCHDQLQPRWGGSPLSLERMNADKAHRGERDRERQREKGINEQMLFGKRHPDDSATGIIIGVLD